VAARCPQAVLCADPFHVVKWATDALDEVRRELWNTARNGGEVALAGELKGARWALWKNPEDLTRRQRGKLAWIARVNRRLYRADLLKEQLGLVFKLNGVRATVLLEAWLGWARRCRIPALVKLAKAVSAHRSSIQAALTQGAVQRVGGVDQDQDPAADPRRVRVPLPPGADRAGDAQRGRTVPTAARAGMKRPTETLEEPVFGRR
jgi:transposase